LRSGAVASNAAEEPGNAGGVADKEYRVVEIPESERGGWRVEEEFVGAIRGSEKVRRTSFKQGVRYMEFTQAVALSRSSGRAVSLPLH
jgi:hypothetical protein